MTDTAVKRASAIDVSSPWRALLGATLDASVTEADRAVAAYLYSGVDYSDGGPVLPDAGNFVPFLRRRRRGR